MIHPHIYRLSNVIRTLYFTFTLFIGVVFSIYSATEKTEFNYDAIPFNLKDIKEHIAPVDMDGDGLKDLICSKESTISIYFQNKNGANGGAFNLSRPDITIELPGNAVGWDIDYPANKQADNANTSKRIIAILEGKSVMAWSIRNRTISAPVTLLENLPGFLPKGAYPLNFIRDVNADKLNDIVLPGSGKLYIYLQNEKGAYDGNIFINTSMIINSALATPVNIAGNVGEAIIIPALTIRDVNNDKQNDVISTDDKITEVFLGLKDGGFPAEPSYRIDLNTMTEPQKEVDWDTIDFSNIFSAISTGPQQYLQDLDGDKIEDLLLLSNGKISVYSGTPTGMDLSKPLQILKSSGNVLSAFVAVTQDKVKNRTMKDAMETFIKENQDKTRPKDLILIRIQDLSVGDIFTWLVFSKELNIDFYIYKNQGKTFEKRPGRKITLTLKLPSALKLFSFVSDQKNAVKNPESIRVVRANIGKNKTSKDRLLLKGDTIQGFQIKEDIQIDKMDENQFNEIIKLFDLLGFTINEDHYSMDIDKMLKNLPELGNFELLSLKDKEPAFRIDINKYLTNTIKGTKAIEQSISPVDLNGDSRDDIFLFTDRDDEKVFGTLFLSR
jgi:cbb3-type cytochrome oxidase subunit 3